MAITTVADKGENDQKAQGVRRFEIGELRLLFKLKHNGMSYELAYINMFFLPFGAQEPNTQLQIAKRTNNFKVVPISAIVRHVHLIPYFTQTNSALQAYHDNLDVYSFSNYLVNKYCDRFSWINFC